MGKTSHKPQARPAPSPEAAATAPRAMEPISPERDRACRAYGAACEAARLLGGELNEALGWETAAEVDFNEDVGSDVGHLHILAGFVRAHPAAPPEALYRFGAASGVHGRDADAWAMQPVWLRAGYETFAVVLRLLDRLAAEEAARAALPAPDAPAPRAAALALPEDQTTLARLPDPLALRDDLTPRLTRAADDGA